MINIRNMTLDDIESVLPLYINYYNTYEEGRWTEQTARKRIQQVITMMDSFSLDSCDMV